MQDGKKHTCTRNRYILRSTPDSLLARGVYKKERFILRDISYKSFLHYLMLDRDDCLTCDNALKVTIPLSLILGAGSRQQRNRRL
jgi:hypothetical protein